MTTHARKSNAAYAGHHPHPLDRSRTFKVYYKPRGNKRAWEPAGWYWRLVPPDPLLDREHGAFTSSRAAYRDAHANLVDN